MTRPEINLTLQLSVAELLTAYPQVIPVFLHRQMACVGCAMSTFDDLDEAARNYDIPGDQLLEEIRQAVYKQPPGEQNDPQPHLF
jgi:hybrid cluster-associated redox disulfide protein